MVVKLRGPISPVITDAIYSLVFQFVGGPEPAEPFPDCGIAPAIDALDCQSYPGCQ